MKKNNPYITDDEIDFVDLARTLWREKILILTISIISGLVCYLYASFQPEEFKIEIKIKNPPSQLFEPYIHLFTNTNNSFTNSNINNINNNFIIEQFNSNFKLNFLSLDNLEIFVEESRDIDTFKKYLKSRNISAKLYFAKKFGEEKNKNIPSTYFLFFDQNLFDGNIFINNYSQFIKNKNITEFKENLKLTIENKINNTQDALEIANLINLENPILKSPSMSSQVVNEPEALFYKGTRVLEKIILIEKKLLQKLENDQFNYSLILDKGIPLKINTMFKYFYFLIGLFFGFFLSFVIIFFKSTLKNK